jgi:FkbM family methyltransferase
LSSGRDDWRDALLDAVWITGVRAFHLSKRYGGLGRGEQIIQAVTDRILPQPAGAALAMVSTGAKLLLPPGTPRARTYLHGMYEPELTRAFPRLLWKGATVVDLGANIGYYSMLAASLVGDTGRVYAFEPQGVCLDALVRSTRLNEFTNVIAVKKAVTDAVGEAVLARVSNNIDQSALFEPHAPAPPGERVKTTTLDAYFGELGWPSVDLVKMDIQGSEAKALRGMAELSRRNPGMKVVVELGRLNLELVGSGVEELETALLDIGFRDGLVLEREGHRLNVADGLPRTNTVYNMLLWKER